MASAGGGGEEQEVPMWKRESLLKKAGQLPGEEEELLKA